MKRICVFCGSSYGTNKKFRNQAKLFGIKLAQQKIGIVYGGANVGLMGAVAEGVLENNGSVIGVLPEFLKTKEIAHEGLNELIVVKTMHERKVKMNELCDGVIALPGGFGTLEELFEMLTWGQLGLHNKPVALLNIDGYFNPLMTFVQSMVDKGFLKEQNQKMLIISDNIDDLLYKMKNYIPMSTGKWIENKSN